MGGSLPPQVFGNSTLIPKLRGRSRGKAAAWEEVPLQLSYGWVLSTIRLQPAVQHSAPLLQLPLVRTLQHSTHLRHTSGCLPGSQSHGPALGSLSTTHSSDTPCMLCPCVPLSPHPPLPSPLFTLLATRFLPPTSSPYLPGCVLSSQLGLADWCAHPHPHLAALQVLPAHHLAAPHQLRSVLECVG